MNHLSTSTSPYLLQHAHNPVDWYPWGEEALQKARAENKPIFLSIGYAACHWCHVMAHESFEDPAIAALMNEHFVSIKVDREERPDLDGIYMQAVTALTGSGGWPMSVFLTPDLRPFYGGTYFPPTARYNLPSFRDLLSSLNDAWQNRRDEIERAGSQLNDHLLAQAKASVSVDNLSKENLSEAEQALVSSYDSVHGGWGAAPKFPQAMTIEFLLARATNLPIPENGQGAAVALHSLRAMARGGMYDVVGGGFARYSTDNNWLVPHFEKMLYDNALLARAYLHAYQITGDKFFRRIVEETLNFVAREMTHPQGGFYSSLDADSEGREGKFYIWTLQEIREHLLQDSEFFETAYGINNNGNWEGSTVLQRALDDASLAARFKLDVERVAEKLADCHLRLLAARAKRIRPGTDDKVLTAWNGLTLATFAEAARLFGDDNSANEFYVSSKNEYYELATRNAEFLLSELRPNGQLRRAWREGRAGSEVFLEDYAALILGLLELYQTDFNDKWFAASLSLADEMILRFKDGAGGFFDTPSDAESLIVRPKDIQDNATPSGNALAAEALLKLAALTDRGDLRDLAEKCMRLPVEFAARYPTGFARWLTSAEFMLGLGRQIAVVGNPLEARELMRVIRERFQPEVVIAASRVPPSTSSPALLSDRPLVNGKAAAYVCENFVCKRPVTSPAELRDLLA